MTLLVQTLQILSGLIWLLVAVLKLPLIARSWHRHANRETAVSARNGILAWLMVGFCARWFVWPEAIQVMAVTELTTWAALYALSGLCAVWFLTGAIQNRSS